MFTLANHKFQTLAASFALCLTLCLTVAFPSIASAQTLKSQQILVDENVVRLGDIFEVNEIFAAEELFQSPPLGRNGILSAKMLLALANKYDIDWNNPENLKKITVSRAIKTIDLDEIKAIITDHAYNNQFIVRGEGHVKVKLNQQFNKIVIAASEYSNFIISNFVYRPFSDHFSAEFKYSKNGRYHSQTLSGKIENLIEVPVFINNIKRNQIVQLTDLKFIQINNRKVVENYLLDIDEIVGKTARSNLRAMQPISEQSLKYPDLVKKNSVINLLFKQGRIQVKLKARALTTGAKGALIRVMNLKSGKQIDAIVTGIDQAMTLNSSNKDAIIVASSQ